jgi:dihydroorotate dehydrogenase electron transfer subunit
VRRVRRGSLRLRNHRRSIKTQMTTSGKAPGIFLTRVLRRRIPCPAHFELTLAMEDFPSALPGQFLEVLCRPPQAEHCYGTEQCSPKAPPAASAILNPQFSVMLRRPFSIAALRRSGHGCEIDLLGRVTGEGTAWLAARNPGDAVDVLGPLGHSFSMPPQGTRALLVAGGVGLPPIRWLGEELRKQNIACNAIFGAMTRDFLPVALLSEPPADGSSSLCVDEFARYGIKTVLTTDDGSCGMRGQVTDGLRRCCEEIGDLRCVHVYACGSVAMLQAVARFCAERGLPCEVAMERKMACGMGTCQSCVVPVADAAAESGWRYALCCTDGTVFNAADVLWPRLTY